MLIVVFRKELDRTCTFFEAIRAIQVCSNIHQRFELKFVYFQYGCETAQEANEKYSLTQELLNEVREKYGSTVAAPGPPPPSVKVHSDKNVQLQQRTPTAAPAVLSNVMRPLSPNTPKIPKKIVNRG